MTTFLFSSFQKYSNELRTKEGTLAVLQVKCDATAGIRSALDAQRLKTEIGEHKNVWTIRPTFITFD